MSQFLKHRIPIDVFGPQTVDWRSPDRVDLLNAIRLVGKKLFPSSWLETDLRVRDLSDIYFNPPKEADRRFEEASWKRRYAAMTALGDIFVKGQIVPYYRPDHCLKSSIPCDFWPSVWANATFATGTIAIVDGQPVEPDPDYVLHIYENRVLSKRGAPIAPDQPCPRYEHFWVFLPRTPFEQFLEGLTSLEGEVTESGVDEDPQDDHSTLRGPHKDRPKQVAKLQRWLENMCDTDQRLPKEWSKKRFLEEARTKFGEVTEWQFRQAWSAAEIDQEYSMVGRRRNSITH
jgi:hypothetical protein